MPSVRSEWPISSQPALPIRRTLVQKVTSEANMMSTPRNPRNTLVVKKKSMTAKPDHEPDDGPLEVSARIPVDALRPDPIGEGRVLLVERLLQFLQHPLLMLGERHAHPLPRPDRNDTASSILGTDEGQDNGAWDSSGCSVAASSTVSSLVHGAAPGHAGLLERVAPLRSLTGPSAPARGRSAPTGCRPAP